MIQVCNKKRNVNTEMEKEQKLQWNYNIFNVQIFTDGNALVAGSIASRFMVTLNSMLITQKVLF